MNRHLGLALCVAGLSLAACHGSRPDASAASAAVVPAAPEGCHTALSATVPVLTLPSTDAPKGSAVRDASLDVAQIHTVNRPLPEIGVWSDSGSGWSVLALQFGSPHARSITVRLRDLKLPKQSQVWLCSADGSQRQGPFATATAGEIWPPAIGGTQARLEVWALTAHRDEFAGLLADVYGGYR